MHSILPYIAGLLCSICYGSATVLEQFASRRQASINSLSPAHFIRLFQQLPFILGIILDLVGWALFLYAARTLPLFLVLSFVATSLLVSALLAAALFSNKISATEVRAISIVMVGLVLLGVVAEPSTASSVSQAFRISVSLGWIPIGIVGLLFLQSKNTKQATIGLGICSGLLFGATGLISRILNISTLSVHALFQPLVYSLIVYGVLGMLFLTAGLQRGNINVVNSAVFTSELAIPSLLGILFLSDKPRNNLWILVAIGFSMVIYGTIYIARISRPDQK